MEDNHLPSSEIDDFLNEFKDVTPLKNNDVVPTQRKQNLLAKQLKRQAIENEQSIANNYLSIKAIDPIDPYDHISFKQDGIQDGVFKNLRLGKYKIDGVINLQQQTFEQARQTLFNQVLQAHKGAKRTVLIKHGLGLHSKPYPAHLKSYVNLWLQQMPEVIAFHTALPNHGGNSSVYALLKKNQQEKAQNRELHRKK